MERDRRTLADGRTVKVHVFMIRSVSAAGDDLDPLRGTDADS